MSCERNSTALAEVAAGGTASAELEAHLAGCAACRAALAELREALAVADGTLAELAAAEPSPALRARIRHAVAAADAGTAWPITARVAGRWACAMAAAVLLIAVVVVSRGRGWFTGRARTAVATAQTTRPAAVGSTPPTATSPTSAAAATLSGQSWSTAGREGRAAGRRLSRAGRRAQPEVLVPPGQEQALLQLVALANRGDIALAAMTAAGEPSADLPEPADIQIKPLEIVPLDPAEGSGT